MDKLEKIKDWYNNTGSAFPFDIYTLDDQTIDNCYNMFINGVTDKPNNDFACMMYADYFYQVKQDYVKALEYYQELLDSEHMYMKTGALSTIGIMYCNGKPVFNQQLGMTTLEQCADYDDVLSLKILASKYRAIEPKKAIKIYEKAMSLSTSGRTDLSNWKPYKCDEQTIQTLTLLYLNANDYDGLAKSSAKYFKDKLPAVLQAYLSRTKLEDVSEEMLDLVVTLDQQAVNEDKTLTVMFKMLVRLLKREKDNGENLFQIVI